MAAHDLPSLVRSYGDATVNLEEFARALGLDGAALRMRRQRDDEFPAPLRQGSTPSYRFADLARWLEGLTGPKRLRRRSGQQQDRITAEWALSAAVGRCAQVHGSEATLRFLAGAALRVQAGWRPPPGESAPGLVRELRRPPVGHLGPIGADLPERFVPDPPPAEDETVRALTIDWAEPAADPGGAPVIPADSPDAAQMLSELLELHDASTGRQGAAYADALDRYIAALGGPTSSGRPTTPAPLGELMLSLAGPQPGDMVVDPAAGEGGLLIAAAARTAKRGTQTVGLVGRELDETAWLVAKVRLGLRGLAHALGRPGVDASDASGLDGLYDAVLLDPALGARALRPWLEQALSLTAATGTAVVALPASTVFPGKRPRGKWWDDLQRHIAALVVTPLSMARSSACVLVLRPQPTDTVLLVQIHRRPSASRASSDGNLHPLTRTQIEQAVGLVDAHVAGRSPGDGSTGDWVDHRPISALTPAALGTPRWTDSRVIREVPVARDAAGGSTTTRDDAERPTTGSGQSPSLPGPADGGTGARQGADRVAIQLHRAKSREAVDGGDAGGPRPPDDSDVKEASRRALEALDLLRYLVDPGSHADVRFDPALHGALEPLSTDEIRRALKRLELKLHGIESRGGRRQRRPQAP